MSDKRLDNLIPAQHTFTLEEASKGGQNSAKVRRKRREIREVADILLSLPVKTGETIEPEDILSLDIEANTDTLTGILVQVIRKALEGDLHAVRTLFVLTGEYRENGSQERRWENDPTYEALVADYERGGFDEITGNAISKTSLEKFREQIPEEVEKLSHDMFALFKYHHPELKRGREDYIVEDRELMKRTQQLFIDADEVLKWSFMQRVYRCRNIPQEDAVMLFDLKYRGLMFHEEERPTSVAEILEEARTKALSKRG